MEEEKRIALPNLMLCVMRHNNISRTVIQLTKKCTTQLYSVCILTQTHMWHSQGRSSLAGQILWADKAEKGEVTCPLMTTYGEILQLRCKKFERLSFHFSKAEQDT